MQFRKYKKIYRLGKDETIGILKGTVNITEKLDGANVSVWLVMVVKLELVHVIMT